MRVLFITHCTDMGGANQSLFQLMKELKEDYGISPILLAHPVNKVDPNYNIHKLCESIGIPTIKARFVPFKINPKETIKGWWLKKMLYTIIVFFKLLRYHFGLVHSNSSVIDIGASISRFYHKPHIWHFREFGDLDFGMEPIKGKKYEKNAYKKCDAIIAISQIIANHFKEVAQKDKIQVIYNGILPKPSFLDAHHDNSVVQICIVGRISETKNQLFAIQAVKSLVDKGLEDFHLNIIGRAYEAEKAYYERIMHALENDNISSHITMWGERKDVPEILSHMDVGLMLSESEAFGRVTVEYMMQGLCVIASNSGANPEIVDDRVNGFLYEHNNLKQLCNCLELLINSKSELIRLSSAGKEKAMECFTSQANTQKVFALYNTLDKK